jgi:ABC transporter substrate binding protein
MRAPAGERGRSPHWPGRQQAAGRGRRYRSCRGEEHDQLMDRRAFIAALALVPLVAPGAAPAQPARQVYRIGMLGLGPTSDMVGSEPRGPITGAFLRGLRELGYVYGEHFVTEPRGAEDRPERYPDLAAELVRLQVDVIVAPGPPLPALKRATSTIPVVMAGAVDPVGQRLVRSLGRPGENFTGLSSQSAETTGKRLELLKALAPGGAPVAVLWDRSTHKGAPGEDHLSHGGRHVMGIEADLRPAGDKKEQYRYLRELWKKRSPRLVLALAAASPALELVGAPTVGPPGVTPHHPHQQSRSRRDPRPLSAIRSRTTP